MRHLFEALIHLRQFRKPVFTSSTMKQLEALIIAGFAACSINAAEGPRPRGVGPECLSALS